MESRTCRFKKRLKMLREHHKRCQKRYTEGLKTKHLPVQELEPDTNTIACVQREESDADEPEVPPLTRTDSVFLTKDYCTKHAIVQDLSDVPSSCIETTGDDDEYLPPKMQHSSSDESIDFPTKIPSKRRRGKAQKSYKRQKQSRTPSDDSNHSEHEEPSLNSEKVSVLKLKKKGNGGRVYNKRHYCLYCPVSCYKMARHLVRKHSSEIDVAKAISFPLKSKQRKLHLDLIRNKGNRAHNNEVLKSGTGTLIPGQQSSNPGKPSDYMHCINCEALLKRKCLWRHMSRCRLSKKCSGQKPGRSRIQSICAFAQPAPEGVSVKVWELINAMHQDEVSQVIKGERTIIRLGELLFSKHGHDKNKHEYIRQKMREIGRLVLISRKEGKLQGLEDFFKPSNFNIVVEMVKKVSGFNEDTNAYKTPSLALKLGHSLKKISDILECETQMSESIDEEFLENIKRTRTLFEKKWDVCISSRALQTLTEAKWNTPHLLPFTDDVKKMHIYIDECRKASQNNIKDNPNKKTWTRLANVTLCEVILFNRRREGEVSKMPLSAFTLRDTAGVPSDLATSLTELEQKLCKHFQRIEIRGKRNRKVPILLTPEMLTSMETLVSLRRTCGVPDENPYFFARPEADTHLRGSDAIREVAQACGAKHPETLSSTKLRKQVATLSTVLNLKDNEMDTLADFLGHDIRVHRQYYRLPEGTMQLAKVSKVLVAMEQGRLSQFKGMNMDQIQIDPNEKVSECAVSDVSETEGDSSWCSAGGSSRAKTSQLSADEDSDLDGLLNSGTSTSSTKHQMESRSEDSESGLRRLKNGHGSEKSKKRPLQTEPMVSTQQRDSGIDTAETGASKRRTWSSVECRAVEKILGTYIEGGRVPGKKECLSCIEASPRELEGRTWQAVKFFVKNKITALRRESSKRR
ncbi:uncharacterized protein LOC111946283 isoform X2 [Oryzias latipes]|uniref:uncharacterized protein LOC111946283 isoform X2 n=1 Tax=Oryzias latipes TaxID=8090 RepID=UPI000CE1E385|nr:uncharacterized protein LOC111946283 isoform X2 [Oryzias latipes]